MIKFHLSKRKVSTAFSEDAQRSSAFISVTVIKNSIRICEVLTIIIAKVLQFGVPLETDRLTNVL